MTELRVNSELLRSLQDKVVVLTGGATGIGRAAARLFTAIARFQTAHIQGRLENGAKVVFGDVNETASSEVVSQSGTLAHFVRCDTSSYSDQLELFAKAEELYGKVDIVLANAGIVLFYNIFGMDQDITKPPPMGEIEINLKGIIYTTRIGMAYLRKQGGGDIVLTSSVAGFKPSDDVPVYTAGKHGVLGLMRGLYGRALEENIRINTIAPYVTKTQIAEMLHEPFVKAGLPFNEAEDVARAMLICATANRAGGDDSHPGTSAPFTGKLLFVSGSKTYEIEDNIQLLEPQWLGKENSEYMKAGNQVIKGLLNK